MEISYEDFRKVQIRIGTVLSVIDNVKARQPALVLEIDFGENIGIKTSSAKITHYYNSDNLIGKQIIAVCNFTTKNIAGITYSYDLFPYQII
jgi:tRNA-binding protein